MMRSIRRTKETLTNPEMMSKTLSRFLYKIYYRKRLGLYLLC